MSTNQTVESPNFEKISKEAGNFTSDAVNLLWAAMNDTRATERRDFRRASDVLEPKVLILSPSASVDDLDLQGCSVVSFTGASSVNFTGMRAPETNKSRLVIISVTGAGTITRKHNATSEAANRLFNSSGADAATNQAMYLYVASAWRQIA